jgi:hypothetical protein
MTAARRMIETAFRLAAVLLALAAGTSATAQAPAPEVCRIGVNLEDLYSLDMAGDTFGAILWLWSLCPSADLEPLGSIAFPTAAPGLNLSPIETVVLETGERYASRRVQGVFRFNWDMDHYPFDRQRIVIPIDETRYGAGTLLFEPDERDSFLTPDLRDRLYEWTVSDLALEASVSDEPSTYGQPGVDRARFARLEISTTLERANVVTFLKLTSGMFAGVFIAFLTFFHDSNDKGGFGSRLGLLVGVLFAVLINLRTADASIGDTGYLTLVTELHLATLVLVVALALLALRDRRRMERGVALPHPDWRLFGLSLGVYAVVVGGLIARAALS